MRVKFINERALSPMLRDVLWTEDREPHRRGAFRAQVLEGESQSATAGPTLEGMPANPWTVRVPPACVDNALASLIRMGDELTVQPGVKLTVQQVTASLDGYLVIRCTAEERAPIN